MKAIKRLQLKGSFGLANFLTPYISGWYECGPYQVELSYSKDISTLTGTLTYGVTVMRDGVHDHEKSTCFGSLHDANIYMEGLENGTV